MCKNVIDFHPLCYRCCEIFLSIPLRWRSLPVSLSLGHLHFFFSLQPLSLFMSMHSPSQSSSVVCQEFLKWWHCQHIHSYFLYNSIHSDSNFSSNAITFHFFAALSSLVTNSLFWVFIFVKCHVMWVGVSLRDKKAAQLHTLLSVFELSNRCTVTNYRQTLKVVMWLVTDHYAHLFFIHWFDIYPLLGRKWKHWFEKIHAPHCS